MLGELDAKHLEVADLLLACNHIQQLERLDQLPIFDLVLAKKKKENKKDRGTVENKGELKQSETADKSAEQVDGKKTTEKNAGQGNEKKTKGDPSQQKQQHQKHDQVKEKPQKLELSDSVLTNFLKIKFVVGQITSCEVHPEADKLLIEKINIGEMVDRNVCSGLKLH